MTMTMNCSSVASPPQKICSNPFSAKSANNVCEYCCTGSKCNSAWTQRQIIDDCVEQSSAERVMTSAMTSFGGIILLSIIMCAMLSASYEWLTDDVTDGRTLTASEAALSLHSRSPFPSWSGQIAYFLKINLLKNWRLKKFGILNFC